MTGDDTGYLHVAPHHVLDMNGVREGRGNQTIVHSLDVTGDIFARSTTSCTGYEWGKRGEGESNHSPLT